jgi:DNA-binding MarR family transcriptional regulator
MLSRLVTNPLERMLAGHELSLTRFQLMVKLSSAPASAIELAHRLRLDPAPIGRSLHRLEHAGLAERASRRRFAPWSLTREGGLHLEILDIGWEEVNAATRRALGHDLATQIVRYVDTHPAPRRREHRGWTDDD